MTSNIVINNNWEFNILNIYNFNLAGPYSYIFRFIEEKQSLLGGDILEAGVYRGRMTLALATFLKRLNLPGTVYGFDTFEGFPKLSREDSFENFEKLWAQGEISDYHFEQIKILEFYNTKLLQRGVSPDDISTSGRFEVAKLDELKRKIEYLRLDNIKLVKGPFEATMNDEDFENTTFSLVFIDCDLYAGYMDTLSFAWKRLLNGGIVFLDEYYSLKFPGARLAVKEFFYGRTDFKLIQVADSQDDFERWVILKDG